MSATPQRIGNYKIERRIGKGGTSRVYLGRHRILVDRVVAVKILNNTEDEAIERFRLEAELTSKLRHDHIIQIHDHGEQPPHHYTIMEFVDGGSLMQLLAEGKRMPLEGALQVFRAAGSALDYAHANGVIHRDVSPANILIERGMTRILLTDFGIARAAGTSGVTTVRSVMGTPDYMSPEHAVSATAVTHLSDIYCLGIVLYQMLSGRLPWDPRSGMPEAGSFRAPRRLREIGVDHLPEEVDRVLQTMLAVDPLKRYSSAQAAVDELDSIINHHSAATRIVRGGRIGQPPPSVALGAGFVSESVPHPIETALGPDLLKTPLDTARRREEQLRDGQELVRLLDGWSSQGQLRHTNLGRRAVIHSVSHSKACTYELRVLYETREPEKEIEEPIEKVDPLETRPKLEKEAGRWSVTLPDPKDFIEQRGDNVRLPGTRQAAQCDRCQGVGRLTCPRCKGTMLVLAPVERPAESVDKADKPAAQSTPSATAGRTATATPTAAPAKPATPAAPRMIPCPECRGKGAVSCERCTGKGNLLRYKTISWRRWPVRYEEQDDLGTISSKQERAIRSQTEAQKVYNERCVGGTRPEWEQVPALRAQLEVARSRLDADTRIVLSEVQISFIPRTEVIFDLGEPDGPAEPGQPAPVKTYPANIYGFENTLPQDWRFLNWDRTLLLIVSAVAVILLVLLILALVALYR